MHSRMPWKGHRVVLAALWDDDTKRISDYDQDEPRLSLANDVSARI